MINAVKDNDYNQRFTTVRVKIMLSFVGKNETDMHPCKLDVLNNIDNALPHRPDT